MNTNQNFFSYILSAVLSIAAALTIFFSWCPLVLSLYSNFSIPAQSNVSETPMRVVGVNYPIAAFAWSGISLAILILLCFLLAKKKQPSSPLFWVNGISAAFIVSHAIMWMYLLFPFN